jgi:hypothetical protein
MCAHDTERSDVTVRDAITGLLLHLCENIADNLWWVVGSLLRAGYLGREKRAKYE